MKQVKKKAAAVLMMTVIWGMVSPTPLKAAASQLEVSVPDNKVLTYKQGDKKEFKVCIANTGESDLTKITVVPKLRNSGDKWPFQTEYQSYSQTIETLEAGKSGEVSFDFTARKNADAGRYTLSFDISAFGEEGEEVLNTSSFYVNIAAKEQQKPQTGGDKKPASPQGSDQMGAGSGNSGSAGNSGSTDGFLDGNSSQLLAAAGGFDNGAVTGGGGEGNTSGSVPRVIVTGFDTNPAEVKAGSNFTLTIHLKNTSKATRVSNMLFDLEAPSEGSDEQTTSPAFLPSSGSSSIYLDGIKAGGTADISIQLNAKADLVQKPYSINLSMKYEDGNAAQVEAASSLSIPVKQDARFEMSDFEITPATIAAGEEANITSSLYNLGRVKLYNVKAVFEGEGIKKEEIFLGNVEPGASTDIDAMLEGTEPTSGMKDMKMTLSYEDEAGQVATAEKTFQLEITEMEDTAAMTDFSNTEEEKGFPVIPVAVAAVILAAAAAVIVVRKGKKKKMYALEEEGLLDELDRSSENE